MKPYRIQPFQVPAWIKDATEKLRPRERLPVSVWAEQNRVLSGGAINGPWRNDVTPYLVEIMDSFSEPSIEEIIFVKPTQVGGTTAMENMLASVVEQDPAPTMMVYPSDDLAKAVSVGRLQPMFKSCQGTREKFHEHESSVLELVFDGMRIYLNGAGSPADLASKPIKDLFLDEIDKYPGATKKEADAVSLAAERTKTFATNRKIVKTSTPTLRSGPIWKAMEAADAVKHYKVPCPHCGKYIELKFKQIKWPDKTAVESINDRAEMATYVCQECGCIITDQDKPAMLRAGRWEFVRKDCKSPRSVAFWINTLYSPFTRFTDIAKEWLLSQDDPDRLHNFINSWLAEPWEETKLKTDRELVMQRQTELEAYVLPEWTKLLTGGIDVQENCIYWTIRAWGDYMTSQNVAHGQAMTTGEVEQIMNLEYRKADGTAMLVDRALIDSGDQTDDVYDFCAANADWALPCKGVDNAMSHYRLSVVNKAGSKACGMTLVLVDGGKYKDMIASRMQRPNGKGSWMVHKDCDEEYADQVTSEQKVTERAANGRIRTKWVQKSSHAANHYLDCEVYAAAMADILGVRSLFLQNRVDENGNEIQKPKEPPKPTAEESWIGNNEGWI